MSLPDHTPTPLDAPSRLRRLITHPCMPPLAIGLALALFALDAWMRGAL